MTEALECALKHVGRTIWPTADIALCVDARIVLRADVMRVLGNYNGTSLS